MPIAEQFTTNKQHAVPQNIMQVEFKVIGELTMRQFAYLVAGAVFGFAAYKSGLPGFIAVPLALIIALGSVAVAFLPIQERGMDEWVVNFIFAVYNPTQRVWRKEAEAPKYFLYQSAALIRNEMLAVAPTASRRKLEQYLEHETVSKPKDPDDQREMEYIMKVQAAFEANPAPVQTQKFTPGQMAPKQPFIESRPMTSFIPPIIKQGFKPLAPQTQVPGQDQQILGEPVFKPTPVQEPAQQPTPVKTEPPVEQKSAPTQQPAKTPIPTQAFPPQPVAKPAIAEPSKPAALAQPTEVPKLQEIKPTQETKPTEVKPAPIQQVVEPKMQEPVLKQPQPVPQPVQQPTAVPPLQNQIVRAEPVPAPQIVKPVSSGFSLPKRGDKITYKPYNSITPDRLTGRRFTNLSPTQGEIILPIRGERVLNPTSEDVKDDINEKANQLMALVGKIKKDTDQAKAIKEAMPKIEPVKNTLPTPTPPAEKPKPAAEAPKPTASPAHGMLESLKTDNERLVKQIGSLQTQLAQEGKSEEEKKRIQEEIKRLQTDKQAADTQISMLQQKIAQLEAELNKTRAEAAQKAKEQTTQPTAPTPQPPQPAPTPQAQQPAPPKEPLPPVQRPVVPEADAKVLQGPPLATAPNLINGIVKNKDGKLVEGAVVIIKDGKGDVVRALKTNKLGQFIITTPVSLGRYTVEVTRPEEDSPMTYGAAQVEVSGGVLPPLEFTGKL